MRAVKETRRTSQQRAAALQPELDRRRQELSAAKKAVATLESDMDMMYRSEAPLQAKLVHLNAAHRNAQFQNAKEEGIIVRDIDRLMRNAKKLP